MIAMEEANGEVDDTSRAPGAQDTPEDTGNAAGGSTGEPGAGGSNDCGAVAATATAMAAASEAAGAAAAAGTPVARRKSSAQQQTLSPMVEQAMATSDAQVEARIGSGEDGERRRSSSSASFSGLPAAGERERTARQSTLEIPRPPLAPLAVAGHVRGGGSSGSGVEAMGGLAYGLREERGDDSDGNASRRRSTADLEAPSAGRDDMLRRNGVSALNLRDGGFAPGEEGCGRDEEL